MTLWQPGVTLEEVERTVILQALRFYRGNRTQTAQSLNIALRTMHSKLTKYRESGHDIMESLEHIRENKRLAQ